MEFFIIKNWTSPRPRELDPPVLGTPRRTESTRSLQSGFLARVSHDTPLLAIKAHERRKMPGVMNTGATSTATDVPPRHNGSRLLGDPNGRTATQWAVSSSYGTWELPLSQQECSSPLRSPTATHPARAQNETTRPPSKVPLTAWICSPKRY